MKTKLLFLEPSIKKFKASQFADLLYKTFGIKWWIIRMIIRFESSQANSFLTNLLKIKLANSILQP